jgi:hypothetical protein
VNVGSSVSSSRSSECFQKVGNKEGMVKTLAKPMLHYRLLNCRASGLLEQSHAPEFPQLQFLRLVSSRSRRTILASGTITPPSGPATTATITPTTRSPTRSRSLDVAADKCTAPWTALMSALLLSEMARSPSVRHPARPPVGISSHW